MSERHTFLILVKQDAEFYGSNTWWLKGQYEAESPEAAVRVAYADTYFSPSRRKSTRRRDRVAVVGMGIGGWHEFDITLETSPAAIIGVELKEPHA